MTDPDDAAAGPNPEETHPALHAGLSEAKAQARLRAEGYNELPRQAVRSVWQVTTDVFREPMFRLLVAAGGVYLLIGDLAEAMLLLAFAAVSVVITILQQTRTEHALDALRDLSSPRAIVVRDGRQRRVAGREVVRGDIVLLTEGDRVPADALVIAATNLAADESLLTGESVPVAKAHAARLDVAPHPGGDGLPYVFAGSLIVRGSGRAEVRATGSRSEMGQIGVLLRDIPAEATPLSQQLDRLVRLFATAGLTVSAAVVVLYGFTQGAWIQGLLAGIALAMALLPEEFPLVLSVFLALGARRIAARHALARSAASIEALGAATVLCTDKTGTLTLNRMSVAEVRTPDATFASVHQGWPPAAHELLRIATMACAAESTDPMERAILAEAPGAPNGAPVREYGLSPELPAMSRVWAPSAAGAAARVATKGAPEAIADLCQLDAAHRAVLREQVNEMANRGMRVIGVAHAEFRGTSLPDSQRAFAFSFLGLVGLADPLRPDVPAAIAQCRSAGVRVIMVTGDHPATALAIARAAGLDTGGGVLTGPLMDALGAGELQQRLRTVCVCARVTPKHKLRIVQALKSAGEIVAMTGDGVNDAPSLRAAHIGVAMGARGTDVAREASAMVLLDDDFGSIVAAVGVGRGIYDNIRKAMAYILAVHVPIAGIALLPLLFGWPIIVGPIHIVFLEFIIDPVCSIVFEAEPAEARVMLRPPRDAREPLFSPRLILWSLAQGGLALACVLLARAWLPGPGASPADARLVTFLALVFSNVGLIFVNRSFESSLREAVLRPNRALWLALALLLPILGAVLALPLTRQMFGFGEVRPGLVLACAGLSVALVVILEIGKFALAPFGRGARPAAAATGR